MVHNVPNFSQQVGRMGEMERLLFYGYSFEIIVDRTSDS